MTILVHLFARARDLAGADAITVEMPAGATIAELRRWLARVRPELGSLLQRSAVAVNQEFASEDLILKPGDEVALLPPVSGG